MWFSICNFTNKEQNSNTINVKTHMNPNLKNADSNKQLKLFQRYFHKAVQYQSQNNIELAIELYDKALSHNNSHLPTIQTIGLLLRQLGHYDKALEYYLLGEQLHQHSASLQNAIGICFEHNHQWICASEHYTNAIELRENYAEALNNLGNLCRKMGDYQQSEFLLLKSLRLNINVPTLINLGLHMAEVHNYAQAHSFFDHALRLQPFNNKSKWYKALSLLAEGEFKQGWELYTNNTLNAINFHHSEELAIHQNYFVDKHVHISGKQTIDDEIMLSSCLQEIISQAKSCSIECDERLTPLFQRSFRNAEIITKKHYREETQRNSDDITLSMVNVTRLLRQSFTDFPTQYGYLIPSNHSTQFWKNEYAKNNGNLKIGVAWRGSISDEASNNCCNLANWNVIFDNIDCQLINLQHGQIEKEISKFPLPISIWPDCDYQNNIEQLAGKIAALDLVITTNNTVAHLAGALGKTVWIILPYAANWRWFNGRNPCPWYSNARLFQQTNPREWQSLLRGVNSELIKQFERNRLFV